MGDKNLKDPIYGYITVDEGIIHDVVDSPCFQRLRNIVQTSYAPLYSASVHNRFIHSLGVYHLGKIAYRAVSRSILQNENMTVPRNLDRYGQIFLLACLLHDVGHAPFSHTGEEYYLNLKEKGNKRYTELHNMLVEAVGNKQFRADVKSGEMGFEPAKPHEIMSTIVALKQFPMLFKNDRERSFFARCITGYCYNDTNQNHDIWNCLIQLLNSDVIDVDKLDYLIRDAYITGFDTVQIDYIRLLGALRLQQSKETNSWVLVFHKSALSVIQNVVFAHDAERHWIQNHPVVLYEWYILNHAIARVDQFFSKASYRLFSLETLTEEGNQLNENIHISLLADDDLIYLMKNVCPDNITREYFNRRGRRHPAWKSEAEYRSLFYCRNGEQSSLTNAIEKEIDDLLQYVINITGQDIINEATITACEEQIGKLKMELFAAAKKKRREIESLLNEAQNHLDWLQCMYDVMMQSGLEFDLLILKVSQFNSGFIKKEFSQLPIFFPDYGHTDVFGDVVTTMNAEKTGKNKFFYLFYRRKENGKEKKVLDVNALVKGFTDLANRKHD